MIPKFLRSWCKVATLERNYGTVHVYEKKGERKYFVEPLVGEGYLTGSVSEADAISGFHRKTLPPGVRRMERSP